VCTVVRVGMYSGMMECVQRYTGESVMSFEREAVVCDESQRCCVKQQGRN
jgi:hypothetical protein